MVLTRSQKIQQVEKKFRHLWWNTFETTPFILEDHQEYTDKILDFYLEFVKNHPEGEWKFEKMTGLSDMLFKVKIDWHFLAYQQEVKDAKRRNGSPRPYRKNVTDNETEFWKDWLRAKAEPSLNRWCLALERERTKTLLFHIDGSITFKLIQDRVYHHELFPSFLEGIWRIKEQLLV